MDETPKKRDLSEISHLFLSSVRDRQTGGSQRPQRTPPRKAGASIDLTPEELAQVMGGQESTAFRPVPPICGVLGAHLNGKQFDRVKEYARHLAGRVGRVGLIELDASEFRLMCFDPSGSAAASEASRESAETFDPRLMAEAIAEMNCDVNQWILLLPNPKTLEARALLREVRNWTLLTTCDHDGVVSSYRLLKGLTDGIDARPSLSLAVLDARDEDEADRVFRKLAGVCGQFLGYSLNPEPPIRPLAHVSEHLAMYCRPTRDKAQIAAAPQWQIVGDFVSRARQTDPISAPDPTPAMESETVIIESEDPAQREVLAEVIIPTSPVTASILPAPAPAAPLSAAPAPMRLAQDSTAAEVVELSGDEAGGDAILSAILRQPESGLIECPVRPPMCPQARLAVTRERELILLAVARQGLADLQTIGQAYRWLTENRSLIGMAVPQFAIDAHLAPRLRFWSIRPTFAPMSFSRCSRAIMSPFRRIVAFAGVSDRVCCSKRLRKLDRQPAHSYSYSYSYSYSSFSVRRQKTSRSTSKSRKGTNQSHQSLDASFHSVTLPRSLAELMGRGAVKQTLTRRRSYRRYLNVRQGVAVKIEPA